MKPKNLAILKQKAVELLNEAQPLARKYPEGTSYIMKIYDEKDKEKEGVHLDIKVKLLLREFDKDGPLYEMVNKTHQLDSPYPNLVTALRLMIKHIDDFSPVTAEKITSLIEQLTTTWEKRYTGGNYSPFEEQAKFMIRNYDPHGPVYKSLCSSRNDVDSIIKYLKMIARDIGCEIPVEELKEGF